MKYSKFLGDFMQDKETNKYTSLEKKTFSFFNTIEHFIYLV